MSQKLSITICTDLNGEEGQNALITALSHLGMGITFADLDDGSGVVPWPRSGDAAFGVWQLEQVTS